MPRLVDLTGKNIGDWVVLYYVGGAEAKWLCRCVCGTTKPVNGGQLRSGRSKGCGCRKNARIGDKNRRHGHSAGGHTSLTYQSWRSMMHRCCNPNHPAYSLYAGKGIKVDPRWQASFEAFLADMGPRPSKTHTLDRYPDQAGDYTPTNCRWATWSEQNNNRNMNVHACAFGVTRTLGEWATQYDIRWHTLKARLNRGWDLERALSTPVRRVS